MERAAERFALLTCLVLGLSHVLYCRTWAEMFVALHRHGKLGAFANGGLSLVPGAALVATHPAWTGPAMMLTAFGWLLMLKGAIRFLTPGIALRGMEKAGTGDAREFVAGGLMLLTVAAILGYVLWQTGGVKAK